MAYFSNLFLFLNFSNFSFAVVMNSSNNNPHKEMLIKRYFETGLQYREIILILAFHHKVHVSLRTMNRILRKLYLKRKNCPIDTREIISKVQYEIQESGGCLGYRSMHHRLILSGYQCNRETVRLALKFWIRKA